jgi:hypothetical protein
MWFRRRNMGYAKKLKRKKKYGHMKVQVQKEKKNDEHMKAHVLQKEKEKDSHVSK